MAGLALGVVFLAPSGASAQILLDPLHGYFPGFSDNGTNTPTTSNPLTNFGFTVSPGPNSGDFLLEVLAPNNEASATSFHVTGTLSGTATLVSATAWTSGNLDSYLGISASPTNPIGAYLPSTQALDAGATGFRVYQVDLGTTTLQGPSNPNSSPLLNITENLPLASYVVAFLNEGTAANPDWVATANSGAIFETKAPSPPPPPPPVPEPSTIATALSGFGMIGVFALCRRFRRMKAANA